MTIKLTDYEVLKDPDGNPLYFLVPYEEGLEQAAEDVGVPHAVVRLKVKKRYSALRAWREHLKLTQAEVAERLGMTQPSYQKHEAATQLTPENINRFAQVLGIKAAQLEMLS